MELNDAYEKLRISDEERRIVQDYLGCKYTRANLVLDLEPYTVASLEKDGLVPFSTAEELLNDIDVFTKIYAVMMKSENEIGSTLFRRVTDNECKFFSGSTKGFIHTYVGHESPEEEGKTSVVRYSVDGVLPYIDVLEFSDEVMEGDDQIILPPFAKIKKFEFSNFWEGLKYFDATVEKEDLSRVDGMIDSKDDLRQYIVDHFDEFRSFVDRAKGESKAVFDEGYQKANKFKATVSKLVTVMCRERELEISEAHRVCEQEEAKKVQTLQARAEEEQRISMVSGMQNRVGYIPGKVEEFCTNLDKLNALLDTENHYVYYTSKLKIPFSRKVNPRIIKKRIDAIKAAARQMAEGVAKVKISDDVSIDDARLLVAPIQDDLRALESLHLDITGIDYLPHIFEENINIAAKEQIDKRAFDVIKRAKIQKYQEDLADIPETPSLWTRITGRARLQELQRENLRHKIELEKLSTYAPKRTYSLIDVLSDIDSEGIILGMQDNDSLRTLRTDIMSVYEVDEEAVRLATEEKVARQRNLPENVSTRRFRRRKEATLLEETNEFLAERIALQRSVIQRKSRESGSDIGTKTAEIFLSDSEMFDKVDAMLKVLEAKTVDRFKTKDQDKDVLTQDTVKTEQIQKMPRSYIAESDEPTIIF